MGSQQLAGRRPGSSSRDSEPRRPARPKDVCGTPIADPGDHQELPWHFPAKRNQALLIKTNKTKTGSRAQGCRRAASSPGLE